MVYAKSYDHQMTLTVICSMFLGTQSILEGLKLFFFKLNKYIYKELPVTPFYELYKFVVGIKLKRMQRRCN